MASHLLVLGWHNVEGTWCFPAPPGHGPAGLHRQFAALSRLAHVVPLKQALQALANGRLLPPRAVAITFDDGYADNLSLAVPMLRQLGLPATFFLVPGLLSNPVQPWWEVAGWAFTCTTRAELHWEGARYPLTRPKERRAAYDVVAEKLKRRSLERRESAVAELVDMLRPNGTPKDRGFMLDWDGAHQLQLAGFDVGSHTSQHAILSEETADEQFRDLAESRTVLEKELQVPVDVLAYPNGTHLDFDATTEGAVAAADYQFAVTTIAGVNGSSADRHAIRRAVMNPERGTLDLAAALVKSLQPSS
jgi:peptidoglycan/xylan/chitin deacetylase (PgdA/CDA1 family)